MVNPPPQPQIVGDALVHSAAPGSLSAQARPLDEGGALSVGSELPARPSFTPGPWKVAEHSWCETSVYAGDRTIACLDINDATEETQEAMEAQMAADARLIVAAPDLLAALVALEEAARAVQAGEWDRASIQIERQAARAVIERATGGAK